ncbi:MAG: HAD-IA family hydrolase [marine benthic group bacterium]|jgi:pyrophosphatase PpaX|nr:HAD-IA family hydrolase [Candidatus Carthagonibacter metallireducens]
MSRSAGRTRFDTVVFDLDGTLIDSEDLILASFRHTMRTHLGEAPPDESWRRTIGQPLAVQVRDFARSDAEADAMIRTYTDHNLSEHDRLVRPFEGIRDALEELRRRGRTLAIATSKRRVATQMGLAACGLPEDWFASIVTADDVTRYKPDPEPVLRALSESGEDQADRAAYVGDSVHDMRSGRAAGVCTAAVLWGPNDRAVLSPESPDLWIERPGEIPERLGAD